MTGLSFALSALSMCSFIVPLPQSSFAAGIRTSTARTDFSASRVAATAPGPLDSMLASITIALQLHPRTVDVPSTQRRLSAASFIGAGPYEKATAAGMRQARRRATRNVGVRMAVSPLRVLRPRGAARENESTGGRRDVQSGAIGKISRG